jgi:hypothetical protein
MPDLERIAERVEVLRTVQRPRFRRLWAYCMNPMRTIGAAGGSWREKPYRQAQEWGLPARITGYRTGCADEPFGGTLDDECTRKEVVIENDIGWRIETMVDYLFGREVVITSAAPDSGRRVLIGALLDQIIAHNGGLRLFQQMAMLGAVHGFVDVLVKLEIAAGAEAEERPGASAGATRESGEVQRIPDTGGGSGEERDGTGTDRAPKVVGPAPDAESGEESAPEQRFEFDDSTESHPDASDDDSRKALPGLEKGLARLARMVRLEVVEPARVLPFVSPANWREVTAYGQCYEIAKDAGRGGEGASERPGSWAWMDRLRRLTARNPLARCGGSNDQTTVVELITPTRWARYEDGKIVRSGANSLGRIPLVHIQNTAMPFQYPGGSDVEPLIPLQDELNTRLSDRANRITLQSFKMYLGKGIENFTSMPVAPGRMWMSDNEQADVIEFGGDASCPSEESHISEIREALDKASGVTPIAAGAVEGRIGHLTSAVALRITLQALLARTEKKRSTYGGAIEQMCELALAWLDRAGLFHTSEEERRIELSWPTPIPENEMDRLQEAEVKMRLGVSREIVLRELGY